MGSKYNMITEDFSYGGMFETKDRILESYLINERRTDEGGRRRPSEIQLEL